MSTSLAARLSDLRRTHGMSQDTVAEHLGIARQSVSKWERGETMPDSDNLIALAQLYNISLDDLLGLSPTSAQTAEPHEDHAHRTRALLRIACFIIFVLVGVLAYQALNIPEGYGIATGTVIATSPSAHQIVIENDPGVSLTGLPSTYYVCTYSDETAFYDVGDSPIAPTWLSTGWEVSVRYPAYADTPNPTGITATEIHITNRDFTRHLEPKATRRNASQG